MYRDLVIQGPASGSTRGIFFTVTQRNLYYEKPLVNRICNTRIPEILLTEVILFISRPLLSNKRLSWIYKRYGV